MRKIEERRHKIYAHINKLNGKIYIGRTGNSLEHRSGTDGNGYKNCNCFWKAIQEYGWNNFEHIILIDNLTKQESVLIERELIYKYQTANTDYGYNISCGNDIVGKENVTINHRTKRNDNDSRLMAKKPYTTSIDTDASGNFKSACEERGIKMNVILEAFMRQFANNEFAVKITKNGIRLEIEEK